MREGKNRWGVCEWFEGKQETVWMSKMRDFPQWGDVYRGVNFAAVRSISGVCKNSIDS